MSRERIIVIEDDEDLCELVGAQLAQGNFKPELSFSAEQGLRLIADLAPDCVLLDLGLPDASGFDICRKLREDTVTRDLPIIIMTVRDAEDDVVRGLDMGADDYLVKPLREGELLARVRAVLRRRQVSTTGGPGPDRVEVLGLMVDRAKHEITLDGADLELTPTQLRLLHHLAAHPGRVFTREQLRHRVIGGGAVVVDRNIDVHIRAIRKALGGREELVETVRGVGYRFADPDATDE